MLEVQYKKITPSTALKNALEETSTAKVNEAKGTEDSELENIKEGKQKMINSKYSRAYTEVLEIIKYFPEEEYAKTRHNMGFEVINLLAEKYNIEVNKNKFKSLYGDGFIEGEKTFFLEKSI